MNLRKPCEHGQYDPHRQSFQSLGWNCPGGEPATLDDLIEAINGLGVEGTVRVSYVGPEPPARAFYIEVGAE